MVSLCKTNLQYPIDTQLLMQIATAPLTSVLVKILQLLGSSGNAPFL